MNPSDWNQSILAHAPRSGAFLQSHEWGEFQRAVGREVRRYGSGDAYAQVVQYPIKKLSLRGTPSWSRGTEAISLFGWTAYRASLNGLTETIIKDLKTTNGIFLHVEPPKELPITPPEADQLLITKSHQPLETTILDLTKSEDELLAGMHEKTRYNIRLASKHGVVVNRLDVTDPPSFVIFWELLRKTAARQGFHLHERQYYSTMLRVLKGDLEDPTRAGAHIYLATKDGKALATMLAISFAGTVTYLHGGSSDEHKKLMAPYALHWGVIRNAKSAGARAYDFWGIDEHRWPGVTRFKLGFGGEVVSYPNAQELPLRTFWYKIYRVAQRLRP